MGQIITQVDSFTNRPFAGNPAGVCVMSKAVEKNWMQKVAREMNLSETAFLYPSDDGYNLRWFTPSTEVNLCGHATLASAHVLWEDGHLAATEMARFMTKSGELTARHDDEWIELNLPAAPVEETTAPEGLAEALGVPFAFVGKSSHDYRVEVDSPQIVRELKPDMGLIAKIPADGVIVAALSAENEYDFISRFFAPALGIPEDPVTGAAHCALGPYWQTRLGKDHFTAYQASERGGVVKIRMDGDRVRLSGQAVTVMRLELL